MVADSNKEDNSAIVDPASRQTAIEQVREMLGAIPEAWRNSFIRSVLRLMKGGTDLGVAWFDVKIRELKSRQDSKERMRKEFDGASIRSLDNRPDLAERALERHFEEIVGKQDNRERVAQEAAQFLVAANVQSTNAGTAPGGEVPPIEEEWIDGFTRYAENATTERMRILFGRILAGEIRKPGSFSLLTVDILSKLGKREAEWVAEATPYAFGDIVPKGSRLPVHLAIRLSEIGFLAPAPAGSLGIQKRFPTARETPFNDSPGAIHFAGGRLYLFQTAEPKLLSLEGTPLTMSGIEMVQLLETPLDRAMLREVAKNMKEQGAEMFEADILAQTDKMVHWGTPRPIA